MFLCPACRRCYTTNAVGMGALLPGKRISNGTMADVESDRHGLQDENVKPVTNEQLEIHLTKVNTVRSIRSLGLASR